MADFYATLIAHGLRLKESPLADGKFHRVKTDAKPSKKNGWYKLSFDGKVGWFGDYTIGLRSAWRADATILEILPAARNEELRQRRELERQLAGHAIASAKKAWQNLAPMRAIHPYLQSKNLTVQGCDAIRIDVGASWFRAWYKHKGVELHLKEDLIVVPMYRAGQLISLQAIAGNGKKLFWKDAPTKGCSLTLKRPHSTITILAEGYATGLALFQCIPQATVIICFNADNMAYVAADLNLTGMVVVAADNDHATEKKIGSNPGIDKGKQAADAIGCQAVWPEGIEGSDWCDALNEWNSPSAVRSAVMRAVRPVMRVKTPA